MPDSGDFPTFITILSFLGILVALIILLPPEFFLADASDYREVHVPDSFESVDVQFFAETYNDTVNKNPFYYVEYDLGGWTFWFQGNYPNERIVHKRFWTEWIFFWHWSWMDWHDSEGKFLGEYMTPSIIDEYYDVEGGNTTKFIVKDDTVEIIIFITYDRSTYTDCLDAWNNDGLEFMSCIHFDQQNTGMNAWSLIGMLLFFNLPDVHWIINMVIAIPIWGCIAYLIFTTVMKVIEGLPFT